MNDVRLLFFVSGQEKAVEAAAPFYKKVGPICAIMEHNSLGRIHARKGDARHAGTLVCR